MMSEHHKRGGAPVTTLNRLDAWEAAIILSLRRWCEGPSGQLIIRNELDCAFGRSEAVRAWEDFDCLIRRIVGTAFRPLVRHDVGCNCVGSDEYVFAHLVGTASEGHLNDAALIATLLSGPAHAEQIAVLAGEVGLSARRMHHTRSNVRPEEARNLVRLH
ncbi:MAG: hypothetical protein AAF252_04755 [Pseudomonadota bacterium]